LTLSGFSQDLEDNLAQLIENNAKSYVNPLIDAFSTGMNSGWYNTARPHKFLGFDLGLKAIIIAYPNDQDCYEFDLSGLDFNYTFNFDGTDYSIYVSAEQIYPARQVPTFAGVNEPGVLDRADNATLKTLLVSQLVAQGLNSDFLNAPEIQSQLDEVINAIPDIPTPPGSGLEYLPLLVPQAGIGVSIPFTPIEAEVVLRGLPEYHLESIGKIRYFGGGLKLGLDPFFHVPFFPLNISVGAYYQYMGVGDFIRSDNLVTSLVVSKDLNLLLFGIGVYSGIGLENSSFKFSYTYLPAEGPEAPMYGQTIDFEMHRKNQLRLTLGARVQLAIFSVHAAYSFSTHEIFTVGAGISLR
jgi:hypothetical protein